MVDLQDDLEWSGADLEWSEWIETPGAGRQCGVDSHSSKALTDLPWFPKEEMN